MVDSSFSSKFMGGHSAWRKRVANGELAKQGGGAICRHRPRLGRRGKDIEKNKKGNIGGGPNKKKKKSNRKHHDQVDNGKGRTNVGNKRGDQIKVQDPQEFNFSAPVRVILCFVTFFLVLWFINLKTKI